MLRRKQPVCLLLLCQLLIPPLFEDDVRAALFNQLPLWSKLKDNIAAAPTAISTCNSQRFILFIPSGQHHVARDLRESGLCKVWKIDDSQTECKTP